MALAKGLRPTQVVLSILFVRILSVFLVQTWYVPDEYWQTLEVAHNKVFGYGVLTWEWQKGIRSYLYPSMVAVLYSVLKFTGLDYPEAVVLLPRLLQALISTAADYSFYKWTGNRKWALFLILTSWFWFYTSGRTLLQTLETCLVTIGLSVFPFKDQGSYYDKESSSWVWLAVVSVFVRPTSLPIWLVLGVYNLITTNQGRLQLVTRTYVPIGLAAGGLLVALDSWQHGALLVSPWEFFKFNVLHDIASFYGTHPWHWYVWAGVPAVLGVSVVPVVCGAWSVLRRPRENTKGLALLVAAALHVLLFSCIPHKEFRFMLPLLPILLYIAQDVIVQWSRKAKKWQLYVAALVIVVGNVVPALYCGLVHQRAALQVMPLLRDALPNNRSSVAFLMPCHSTPLYSHLHMNVTARTLDCSPPLSGAGTHEAEAFYNNPARWWRAQTAAGGRAPDLLVLYDVLRGRLEPHLAAYDLLHTLPHTQFPQGEVSENILVYQKSLKLATARADDAV